MAKENVHTIAKDFGYVPKPENTYVTEHYEHPEGHTITAHTNSSWSYGKKGTFHFGNGMTAKSLKEHLTKIHGNQHSEQFSESLSSVREAGRVAAPVLMRETVATQHTEQFAESIDNILMHHGYVKDPHRGVFKHRKLPNDVMHVQGNQWHHSKNLRRMKSGHGSGELTTYLQGLG